MKTASLASDTVYNTASFAVRMVGVVVAMAWVARALGPEGQGRFGFAHWIAAIVGQVAVWGLGVAMTRFVARSIAAGRPDDARAAVDLAGRWMHYGAGAVLILGLPIALTFGADLRWPLVLAMPYAAAIAWCAWRIGIAHGLRRFDIVFWTDSLYYALLMVLLSFFLDWRDPIVGAMAAFTTARTVHLAVLWVSTGRILEAIAPARSTPAPPVLMAEIRSYAFQMAAVGVFGAVLWERSELAFLKAKTDYEAIGFYTAAFGLSILLTRVPGVLGQVMLPLVAGLDGAQAGADAIGAAFRRGARLMSLLVVSPVAIVWAAAPAVTMVVYEEAFEPAAPLLRILLAPLVLGGIGAIGAKTLIGGGGHRALMRVASWSACLKMWLCLAWVPGLGAIGAALACATAQAVGLSAEGVVASRKFPAAPDAPPNRVLQQAAVGASAAAATLAAGFVMGGAARGTDPRLALAVQLLAGVAGMVIAMHRFRPLPRQDAEALAQAVSPGTWERIGPWVDRVSERR